MIYTKDQIEPARKELKNISQHHSYINHPGVPRGTRSIRY